MFHRMTIRWQSIAAIPKKKAAFVALHHRVNTSQALLRCFEIKWISGRILTKDKTWVLYHRPEAKGNDAITLQKRMSITVPADGFGDQLCRYSWLDLVISD